MVIRLITILVLTLWPSLGLTAGTISGGQNQDVSSGSSPTFTGTNFTGIPTTGLLDDAVTPAKVDETGDYVVNTLASRGVYPIEKYGGGTSKTAAENNTAWDAAYAAAAATCGVITFGYGTYEISDSWVISSSCVSIQGQGGGIEANNGTHVNAPHTKIKWTGGDGVMVSIVGPIVDVNMEKIQLDANSLATGLIKFDMLFSGNFKDIAGRQLKKSGDSIAYDFVVTGVSANIGNSYITFDHVTYNMSGAQTGNQTGLKLGGNKTNANSCHNVFLHCYFAGVAAGHAVFLDDADNNSFFFLRTGTLSPTTGYALYFAEWGRANYIYHFQGVNGQNVYAETPNVSFPGSGNSIYGLDRENGQSAPTLATGANLTWTSDGLNSDGWHLDRSMFLGEDATLEFEGATSDAYETTVTVTDPTADRTITMPNESGTVLTNVSGAQIGATYITQTADDDLTNEQALGALASGILKNTTTTGTLSIASAGSDYLSGGTNNIGTTDLNIGGTDVSNIFVIDESAGVVGFGTATPGGSIAHFKGATVATHSDPLSINQPTGVAIDTTTTTGAPVAGANQGVNAIFLAKYNNSGSPVSTNFNAIRSVSQIDSSVSVNYTGQFAGINSIARHNGTGTITTLTGSVASTQLMNTGGATQGYTLFASSPTSSSSGVYASAMGLYIAAHKVTGVTNGYGVYSAGSSDVNYFAGTMGIGDTTPAAQLEVDAASGNVGLAIDGDDTNAILKGRSSGEVDKFVFEADGALSAKAEEVIDATSPALISIEQACTVLNNNGASGATTTDLEDATAGECFVYVLGAAQNVTIRPFGDAQCTASTVPRSCCTGSGTGTCTEDIMYLSGTALTAGEAIVNTTTPTISDDIFCYAFTTGSVVSWNCKPGNGDWAEATP